MRKIISLICLLLPIWASAAQPEIRQDAPDRHIVVKGDTLWDIAGKFFSDPWKWPMIWGMNKDTIKDPHWIYPGDVIILDRANGTLKINQAGADQASTKNIVKLSPQVRTVPSDHDAIPSIPAKVIGPFLSQPLVIEETALDNAPTLVGARENRVILGTHDVGFAKGLSQDQGRNWQIYRQGKKFVDPDTKEVLGTEAIYLGDAEVTDFADVSTLRITHAIQEINKGDHLIVPSDAVAGPYLPRAPGTSIAASIISIYGGVSQAGQNTVVTLNKGARDGLQVGHVLALSHKGETLKQEGKDIALPDEQYGMLFVFRVFDKVSYALVMQTRLPAQLMDQAKTP